MPKALLAFVLRPIALLANKLALPAQSLWSFARLQAALGTAVHASNVVLGPVALEGTRNITLGRNARIYPGVVLETQGAGRIVLGDNVVLSRGVHIVAFDAVVLGHDCMVGEYASLRDANHQHSLQSMRQSGQSAAPIVLADNVWVGRGAVLLKGVQIGANAIVGANAVVTRNVAASTCAVGVPAQCRPIGSPPAASLLLTA